jgi:hypothetical protein
MHIRIIVYFKMVFLHCDGRKKYVLIWILYFFLKSNFKDIIFRRMWLAFWEWGYNVFSLQFCDVPKVAIWPYDDFVKSWLEMAYVVKTI